jgi:two-component system nitrogen regulation response regulator GlnG
LAALPASLAASALFGVIRGAYTGADHNKVGFFQSAQGGTLFLDEIGEAPIEVQVLLLRALETQEIQPLGSVDTIPIDVRVIAATDTNLESAIAEGHFRAPLLHRLAGYEIHLPPLRGRRDDVARLLLHFVHQESVSLAADDASADPAGRPWPPAALTARLLVYDWPGNVRQLRNVVRRLVIARRESMDDHELNRLVDQLLATAPLRVPMTESPSKAPSHPATVIDRKIELPLHGPSRRSVEVSEVELLAALEAHRWQLTPTATALGVSRSTLYRLIEGSSRIRKASELESLEISQALEHASDNINAAALELRVSPQGLKRRIKALGPT